MWVITQIWNWLEWSVHCEQLDHEIWFGLLTEIIDSLFWNYTSGWVLCGLCILCKTWWLSRQTYYNTMQYHYRHNCNDRMPIFLFVCHNFVSEHIYLRSDNRATLSTILCTCNGIDTEKLINILCNSSHVLWLRVYDSIGFLLLNFQGNGQFNTDDYRYLNHSMFLNLVVRAWEPFMALWGRF